MDDGGKPYVVNIERAAMENCHYRTALWTGTYLQVTLMCIPAGESIGMEVHEETDQFLRIVDGCGTVFFGPCREAMQPVARVDGQDAVCIPAGTWHDIRNTGRRSLRLYSVYAPPHHPFGTVQHTARDPE